MPTYQQVASMVPTLANSTQMLPISAYVVYFTDKRRQIRNSWACRLQYTAYEGYIQRSLSERICTEYVRKKCCAEYIDIRKKICTMGGEENNVTIRFIICTLRKIFLERLNSGDV